MCGISKIMPTRTRNLITMRPTKRERVVLYVYKSCNKTQKKMVIDVWSGAVLLGRAQQQYVPGGAFSPAMQAYSGASFESASPWIANYKARIAGNLGRRHKVDTDQAPASTYV